MKQVKAAGLGTWGTCEQPSDSPQLGERRLTRPHSPGVRGPPPTHYTCNIRCCFDWANICLTLHHIMMLYTWWRPYRALKVSHSGPMLLHVAPDSYCCLIFRDYFILPPPHTDCMYVHGD